MEQALLELTRSATTTLSSAFLDYQIHHTSKP